MPNRRKPPSSRCGLTTQPPKFEHMMLLVIVVVIVLRIRYGIQLPVTVTLIASGTGGTIAAGAFRRTPARARLH